jgi:hypothetical protein
VVRFENDLDREDRRAAGGDQGWAWVARLEVAF